MNWEWNSRVTSSVAEHLTGVSQLTDSDSQRRFRSIVSRPTHTTIKFNVSLRSTTESEFTIFLELSPMLVTGKVLSCSFLRLPLTSRMMTFCLCPKGFCLELTFRLIVEIKQRRWCTLFIFDFKWVGIICRTKFAILPTKDIFTLVFC